MLVAYRHGLRAAELVTLRWDAIDFAHGRLHVHRVKGSAELVHPLSGRELRALRRLKRDQDPASPFIFTSERGAPFTTAGFRKMIARLGVSARFGFQCTRICCDMPAALNLPMTASYSLAAGLSGTQEHPAHGSLRRAVADPLQELLARLTGRV